MNESHTVLKSKYSRGKLYISVFIHGKWELLSNLWSELFCQGNVERVRILIDECLKQKRDPSDMLECSFSNWASCYHSRMWFELLPFVQWLCQQNITLPTETVIMLCQSLVSDVDKVRDDEMATVIEEISTYNMSDILDEKTIDQLLEGGYPLTTIVLARSLCVFRGNTKAALCFWSRVIRYRNHKWAVMAFERNLPFYKPHNCDEEDQNFLVQLELENVEI